jgi:hypothetical protein
MKIEIAGSSGREASEETGSLLPPSPWPTQVGATPSLAFRALIREAGYAEFGVAL